jgi:CHAD domain-containing protein
VLRKSVRKLTRVLGGLRNIDEAQIFFASRVRTDISADSTLHHALPDLRTRELKRIEKALKEFNHRNLDRMVREMVAGLNEDRINERTSISILAYFSDLSIRQFLPIHQLLADSNKPEQREPRHALRIAIKKWRYFFEIIAAILDRDYTVILELLKEYQSVLGRMNDISEFELLLSKLKLPPDERQFLAAILLAEDALLLENLKELIERKPLTYTFLI